MLHAITMVKEIKYLRIFLCRTAIMMQPAVRAMDNTRPTAAEKREPAYSSCDHTTETPSVHRMNVTRTAIRSFAEGCMVFYPVLPAVFGQSGCLYVLYLRYGEINVRGFSDSRLCS